jgi:hypothetical protein
VGTGDTRLETLRAMSLGALRVLPNLPISDGIEQTHAEDVPTTPSGRPRKFLLVRKTVEALQIRERHTPPHGGGRPCQRAACEALTRASALKGSPPGYILLGFTSWPPPPASHPGTAFLRIDAEGVA